MAKISNVEVYKYRIKYMRQFVNLFDAKKGYAISKIKYLEKDVYREMTKKRAQAFMKKVDPKEVLTQEQAILIDRYFAYVFPPKTFRDNLKMIREYTKGFTSKDGYDLRKFYCKKGASLEYAKNTGLSRKQLQKAVEVVALVTSLKGSRVVKKHKERNKEKLRLIQESAQHPVDDPANDFLTVAFIPVADQDEPLKVDVTREGVVITEQLGTQRYTATFNQKALAKNAQAEITRAFNTLPMKRFSAYNIQAGEFEVYKVQKGAGAPRVATLAALISKALFYMQKYSVEKGYNPNDKNSSWHGNWLGGIVAYKSDGKKHLANYLKLAEETRNAEKAVRKIIYADKAKKRRKAQKLIQIKKAKKVKKAKQAKAKAKQKVKGKNNVKSK